MDGQAICSALDWISRVHNSGRNDNKQLRLFAIECVQRATHLCRTDESGRVAALIYANQVRRTQALFTLKDEEPQLIIVWKMFVYSASEYSILAKGNY